MRLLSHLVASRSLLMRRFPSHALTAIEEAIEASERQHRAEIRVAIELTLDLRALWRVRTARKRAVELFAELGVGATSEQNGVLLYVLVAERAVEIVADRGLDGRVSDSEWQHVATLMQREFAQGGWRDGVLRGIEAATRLLAREFPPNGTRCNEKPNRPAVL